MDISDDVEAVDIAKCYYGHWVLIGEHTLSYIYSALWFEKNWSGNILSVYAGYYESLNGVIACTEYLLDSIIYYMRMKD